MAKKEIAKAPPKAVVNWNSEDGFQFRDLESAWRMAELFSKSGMAPKGLEQPQQIVVAWQKGAELGLAPAAALDSIAVINGRASLWGKAMRAVILQHPLFEDIAEEVIGTPGQDDWGFRCTIRRKGVETPFVDEFTMADAKMAKLTGKGTWASYPRRMLRHRAFSYCAQNAFSDALCGMGSSEELIDMGPTVEVTEVPALDLNALPTPETQEKDAGPISADEVADAFGGQVVEKEGASK